MKFKEFLQAKGIENLEGKSAEEVAELYNEFNTKKREELEKAIEEKASKEDIANMKSEIANAQTEQLKQLNEVLKEQGLAIKNFHETFG